MSRQKPLLVQTIDDISTRLNEIESDALARASEIWGEEQTLQQFHAQIGCRNNEFIDSVRQQFMLPNDYISFAIENAKHGAIN